MCLIIEKIPTTPKEIHAVPCIKSVRRCDKTNRYTTPYRGTQIDKTGILVAHTKTRYKQSRTKRRTNKSKGCVIEGGAIHAYTITNKEVTPTFFPAYNAYAFGVCAYGIADDLACRFVYIPSLDFTIDRQMRVAMCKKWQKDTPTWPQIRKVFGDYL